MQHRTLKASAPRTVFLTLILAAFFLLTSALSAFAACTAPAANAGGMIYNSDYHVAQYCDGTNWIGMGKPVSLGCSSAIASFSPSFAADICGDGTYIYTASGATVKAYTFNGSAFTLVGSVATTSADDLWCGGGNILVADHTGGLHAYTFNGTTFTLKATVAINPAEVWSDGTYIYASDYNNNSPQYLRAYTLGASSFTLKGSISVLFSNPSGITGDGTYVYMSSMFNAPQLHAYTFNGTTFTQVGSANVVANDIQFDSGYLYLAQGTALTVYTFDGANFNYITGVGTTNNFRVWVNSGYIYLADGTGGFRTYTFDGTTLTQVRLVSTTPYQAYGVWSDGTYVYLGSANSNELKAFSKGGCDCSNGGGEGDIMYNADNRVMQYCNGSGWQAMNKTAPVAWGMDLYYSGNTMLDNSADFTGNTDVKTSTVSFWVRRKGGTGAIKRIFYSDSERFSVYFGTDNKVYVKGISGGGAGTVQLLMNSSTAITDIGWHHVMLSFDLNNAANRYMYIDGAAETLTVTTYNNAVIDFTRTAHTVGAGALGAEYLQGELADFYFDKGYTDLSNAFIREKFRNADGTPADLGPTCNYPTGTSPMVCLKGKDPWTWRINKGTGGGFTLSGQVPLPKSSSSLPGLSCSHLATFTATTGTTSNATDIWSSGGVGGYYIYLADGAGGIKAYTFNGTTFTLAGSIVTNAWSVWGDSSYIYVTDAALTMSAYTFNGTSFTLVGSIGSLNNTQNIWGDGTYIYLADWTSGLKAYTFNGSTFTLVGSIASTQANDVWGDGTYIYLADGSGGLKAYTFNGSTFTLAGSVASTGASKVWGDGTYIYLADSGTSNVKAYTFNGTTFTLKGSTNTYENASALWSDGTYLYVTGASSSQAGLRVYTFDGTAFTLEKDTGAGAAPFSRAVWGDGTYVYVADYTNGMKATPLDPPLGLCSCASGLIYLGSATVSGANGIWNDASYIYLADGSSVKAFTFNGSTFTLKGSAATAATARAVWGNGTYIYVLGDFFLNAYTFNGTTFTLAGTTNTGANGYDSLWGDGTYIYAPTWSSGLKAYTFNGSAFTLVGSTDMSNRAQAVWGDGTYIYAPIYTGALSYALRAYTFNGSTFTQVGDNAGTQSQDIWGDGTYIYVGVTSGIQAFTFNGSAFTFKGSVSSGWSPHGDGTYIYSAKGINPLRAHTFNGSTFTLQGSTAAMSNAYHVWTNGSYVFVSDGTAFKAYSLVRQTSKEGALHYNSDYNTLEYCNGTGWQSVGK